MRKTITIMFLAAACGTTQPTDTSPRVECSLVADASDACAYQLGSGTALEAGYVCSTESEAPYGCQVLGSDNTGFIACCPATCGDGICQPLELATDSCPADCDAEPARQEPAQQSDGCVPYPKFDYGCEHQTGGSGPYVHAWECGSDGTPSDHATEGYCSRIGYGGMDNFAWCCTEGE